MNVKQLQPRDRIVLAVDVDTKQEVSSLVTELKDHVGVFKVGLQLLMSEGPDIVRMIKGEGCRVFLDGKFHDIPNTVAKAAANAVRLGADVFDIHIAGGSYMIAAAVNETYNLADEFNLPRPLILGITVLSSLNQNNISGELKVNCDLESYVQHLAVLSKEFGIDGVVASVNEAGVIRRACGDNFVIMCPGIRPEWSATNDQKRIATPSDAIKQGADLMVIGRPITASVDRKAAASRIIDEIQQATDLSAALC